MSSLPRVFLTREIPEPALARLRSHVEVDLWPEETAPAYQELVAHMSSADGLLSMAGDPIDAAAIAAAPKLRVISQMAVGVDNIDLAAASRRAIPVGHTPGVLTETTADLAFGLILAVARRIAEADRFVRQGLWRAWTPWTMVGKDVWGATLGIIGMGGIGQGMARRALGFGMTVLYSAPRAKPEVAGATQVALEELLARSDFVSLHAPLKPETRGLIDARALSLMKPGAVLVNTARGAEVDQAALYEALRSGRLGGAGLDVTALEPIDPGDPLLRLPNVVITPHIGSASEATRLKMAELAVDNLLDGLQGRRPRFCANAASLPGASS